MVCSKGSLGWSSPPGKKTCTFTDQIKDNVTFFNWGCTLIKPCNFTDQIEDNQPNI